MSHLLAIQGEKCFHGGTIRVNGTASQPVMLTSFKDDENGGDTNGDLTATTGAPGDWHGICFYSDAESNRAAGTLRYCRLKYGRDLITILGCSPTIRDCMIQYAEFWGLRAEKRNDLSPAATINGCLISGNDKGIINTDDTHCLDATGNDWGHFTGPKDDSDADDCADYYNPNAKGDYVTDNILVSPWLIPEGVQFLNLSANLQARCPINGLAAISVRAYTYDIPLTNFELSLDLSEAPGMTVNETHSSHAHPYTEATFTGGLFTYYINVPDTSGTVAVIVNAKSDQQDATLAIPMKIEAPAEDPIAPDANSDGQVDAGDIISTMRYILGQ